MGFFNKEIKIGNKIIGDTHPTYFIAEIGANFDGSIEKANRDAYHQSIKKCIDHIAAEYARIGISIPATFDYRLFFIFLPLSEVKQIKESVIQWIDSQEPLI